MEVGKRYAISICDYHYIGTITFKDHWSIYMLIDGFEQSFSLRVISGFIEVDDNGKQIEYDISIGELL